MAAGLVHPRETPVSGRRKTLLGFLDELLDARGDLKDSTATNYRQLRVKLAGFFPEDVGLPDLTTLDVENWRSWMKTNLGLAENSVRSHVKNLKCVLGKAKLGNLVEANVAAGQKTKVTANRDRQRFIKPEDIDRIIAVCPSIEWEALTILARYGGLRCPSEVLAVRWCDVDFDRGVLRVKSPKQEHLDNGGWRELPLFPEVRDVLSRMLMSPEGGEYVLQKFRRGDSPNLRTTFCKLIVRAGLDVWTKPFQNLRSSRATELARKYPGWLVARWLGHDTKVAEEHYWQDCPEEFARAIKEPTGTRKNPQQNPQQAAPKPGQFDQNKAVEREETACFSRGAEDRYPREDSNL